MSYAKEAKTFMSKMEISEEDFAKSGIKWSTLKAIKKSYKNNKERYEKIALGYVGELSKFKNIHTVRYRIKDVDHLLEKVVRKTLLGEKGINEGNYFEKITDIIGIRVLYVFKSDWKMLHEEICSHYSNKFAQNPEIKIKAGDSEEPYKNVRNVDITEGIYRSIHYTLRHTAYDESNGNEVCKVKIEIQTRSIFEEGWSEINHELIYKRKLPSDVKEQMANISNILCALAGECDQLGEVLRKYKVDDEPQHINSSTEKKGKNEFGVSIDVMEAKTGTKPSDLVDIMEGCLDIPVKKTSEKRSKNCSLT